MTSGPISVVICAYTLDRWELLQASIRSVLAQRSESDEVIVVSDHNPTLLERVRTAFPEVRAVENVNATGLSGARNAGVAEATGKIVAFLDDDAAAEPGWIRELAAGYRDHQVQGVGGSIVPVWAGERPRWFPEEFAWVVGCTYRGQPRTEAAVRNMIGANMSFRRSLFERIGGFQSTLGRVGNRPVGGEETELCIRAAAADPTARFLLRPEAVVRHHVPVERATLRYFIRRCFAEGLSKAVITRVAGHAAGLASERGYATRTLPLGVLHGLRDVLRGDPWGGARAAAIVGGLAWTTAGYAVGLLRSGPRGQRPSEATTHPGL